MRALNHISEEVTHTETVVRIVGQWPRTHDFESSRKGKHYLCQNVYAKLQVPPDPGVSPRNFRVSGPIAWINPYAYILFPDIGVMNV